MIFETEVQKWITSLKQASLELIDPAASDYLWTRFRRWVYSETYKMQENSYRLVQQNFSNLLKVFEDQVLSQLLKEEVLPLDNAPWSEYRPTYKVQPESEDLNLTDTSE